MLDRDVGQERLEPIELRSSESCEPISCRGKNAVDVVDVFLTSCGSLFNRVGDVVASEESRISGLRFRGEVIDRRNSRFVSSVELVEDLLRERSLDVAEH